MLVLYDNGLWDLNIPFILFDSFKRNHEEKEVEITEHTNSSYKRQKKVSVQEIEDYSIVRNLVALGRA